MRQLTRPAPPEWFAEFQIRGEHELAEMNAGEADRSLGALSQIYLFRNQRYLQQIKAQHVRASEGCCHVCESAIDASSNVAIEHFRPKLQAGNARKDRSHPRHYWWLIYEWANLQVLCPVCNRYKGSLFPIEGARALPGTRGEELIAERPLLINPFDDDPAEHVAAATGGLFVPLTHQGKVTIEVYQLNRPALVERRMDRYRVLQRLVKEFSYTRLPDEDAKRAAIDILLELVGREFDGYSKQILGLLITTRETLRAEPSNSLTSSPTLVPKKFKVNWIKRVEVRSLGPFEELDIAFPGPEESLEPWLGLVGENGVGKSTLLKAIAIALVSREKALELIPDARLWRNRSSRRRSGYVEIELNDLTRRRISFDRHSETLRFDGPEIQVPVIAFGANRITDRRGSVRGLPTAGAVDNLFDPVLPLTDTERWLADPRRVSSRNFNSFGEDLRFLLDLPLDTRVTRRNGQIYFHRPTRRDRLSEMSDGFRSVIGLVGHIMRHLAADTPVMSEAEGTVLLDEIELHLHPVWKIKIIQKLRDLFPRVRFIITTHDPLCLRGLRGPESHLLKRDPATDHVSLVDLVLRPGMTADDLLTGGWFGLGTTLDSETEEMIYRLSALSLKEDQLRIGHPEAQLSGDENSELQELHRILQYRLPGIGGAVSERQALANIARGTIDAEQGAVAVADDLADKIRSAFDDRPRLS